MGRTCRWTEPRELDIPIQPLEAKMDKEKQRKTTEKMAREATGFNCPRTGVHGEALLWSDKG